MTDFSHEARLLALEALRKQASLVPTLSVNDVLDERRESAREDLTTAVEIEDVDEFPSEKDMYSQKRKWLRVKNVVAVFSDLKSSTALNFGKHVNTSARFYEAATGSAVGLVAKFNPQWMDIQ